MANSSNSINMVIKLFPLYCPSKINNIVVGFSSNKIEFGFEFDLIRFLSSFRFIVIKKLTGKKNVS